MNTTAKLKQLIRKHGAACYYCGEPIVQVAILREQQIIRLTCYTVSYRAFGKIVHKARIATIEHLKPRAEGGTNHDDNLRPACAECNSEKQREQMVRRSPGQRRGCRRCGAKMTGKDRRRRSCRVCREFYASLRDTGPLHYSMEKELRKAGWKLD
jgi:hypothetical protein